MDPIRKIKSHVFFGKKYHFRYGKISKMVTPKTLQELKKLNNCEEFYGLTDDNRSKGKTIYIDEGTEGECPRELLRVLIDEGMHALDSTIDNDIVEEKARDLATFLWRCGYRRTTQEDSSDTTQIHAGE